MDGATLIKLMRPGSFTSMEGVKVSFSQADLEGSAAAYDVASDPAPLVVGHPKHDAPAFGWVKDVVFQDGHLCAVPDPAKLDPAFAEAVNAGRFPKVSGKFYLADDPNNPKPGTLYLKNIGFLGGAAPAVKGLGTVAFEEERDAATITIEQPMETGMPPKTDQEVAFAEREAEIARQEAALAERETAIKTREGELTTATAKALHDSNVAFAEALIGAGTLAPAGKDLVVTILDDLDATKTVSFGEGDAKQDLTPVTAFKKLFEGAGKIVSFGELAAKTGADDALDPQAIADRAQAFAEERKAAGQVITIQAAVRHVMKHDAA